jgi:hypothetical protein
MMMGRSQASVVVIMRVEEVRNDLWIIIVAPRYERTTTQQLERNTTRQKIQIEDCVRVVIHGG